MMIYGKKGEGMKILIIIPAYNEADNIKRVVDNLILNFPQYDYLIVNDGSSDLTSEICRKYKYNIVDLPVNLGLAGAFQTGIKYAKYNNYDCAIQYDGDGQHNAEYIESMQKVMNNRGADIVIGSRFIEKKKSLSARMIGNSILGICIKLTTGKKIVDPTSGMRMFNRRMINILSESMNCGPEPDTIAYLIRCGATAIEVPVIMNERIAGKSYFNLSRSVKYMLNMCTSILIIQWFRKKVL